MEERVNALFPLEVFYFFITVFFKRTIKLKHYILQLECSVGEKSRKLSKMAKKSSGKRSSNRVAQKASAEAKLADALERAYAIKPGDKMTVIFGRVEKEMGFSQFRIVVGKNKTVNATPIGVFTKKSCPITAGQVVIMEPTEHEGQTHLIIARLDKKKDVKALSRMGIISKDIFDGDEIADAADDMFDWGDGEDSEAESGEETAEEKHAWKSRGKTYIKKKKAPPSGSGGDGGASGGAILKETVAATAYAEHATDDGDEAAKKPRRRKVVTFAPPPVTADAAPAAGAAAPAADDLDIWAGVAEETFQQRAVPTSWEDDDALNIDEI